MRVFQIPVEKGAPPYDFYIGEPSPLRHPLYYQDLWWRQEHELVLPDDVMESFERIYAVAAEHNVNFEELAEQALSGGQQPDARREGNVLYADFSRSVSIDREAVAGPMLSADPTLPDSLFFDTFRVEGEHLHAVCDAIAADMVPPDAPGAADGGLAGPLLAVLLFALGLEGDRPAAQWGEQTRDFLSEDGSYFLAVLADTQGYRLRVADLGVLEFFFCCSIPVQDDVMALVLRSLGQWAGRPPSPRLLAALAPTGLEKKDVAALKKTLKTLFHSL